MHSAYNSPKCFLCYTLGDKIIICNREFNINKLIRNTNKSEGKTNLLVTIKKLYVVVKNNIEIYNKNSMYQTLYFRAKTFFTMTKFKSDDSLVCRAPPISVTNSSILTCRVTYNNTAN